MPWIKQPPILTKKQLDEITKHLTKWDKKVKGKVKRGHSIKLKVS